MSDAYLNEFTPFAFHAKLFSQQRENAQHTLIEMRAGLHEVRSLGVDRAFTGSLFFAIVGLISAVGTALVYGLGGYFVISGKFTVGTIVAFGSYLASLHGALQGLANAPLDFSTSLVSFERVFEVLDLPPDIIEMPEALVLERARGEITFDAVSFQYEKGDEHFLSDVHRYGSIENVAAALSGKEELANHAADQFFED